MEKMIYASIEDAQKLKKAGFDRDCVHKARYQFTDFEASAYYDISAYGRSISEKDTVPCEEHEAEEGVITNLPTLEEIDLPEDIIIVTDTMIGTNYIVCEITKQIHDKGVIAFEIEMIKELGLFPTKLQAACMAWIYFNGKKEANNA